MGVIGILPSLAEHFDVSISKAGWLVSLFALVIAVSGPTMPILFSSIDRKKVMLLVLGVFVLGSIVSIFTTNFTVALIARIIPAFFHHVTIAVKKLCFNGYETSCIRFTHNDRLNIIFLHLI